MKRNAPETHGTHPCPTCGNPMPSPQSENSGPGHHYLAGNFDMARIFGEMIRPSGRRSKSGAHARPSFVLATIVGGLMAGALALWQPGIRVVDGDTIDHGFWRWRIAGIDAPETGSRAKCAGERRAGVAARDYLAALIASGADVHPMGGILAVDRYGRRIARVMVGGDDVARIMIANGSARAYDGGARQPWCP